MRIVTITVYAIQVEESNSVIDRTDFSLPITLSEGDATLNLAITLFYCEETTFCLIDEVTIIVPVTVSADSETTTIAIERQVVLPEALQ